MGDLDRVASFVVQISLLSIPEMCSYVVSQWPSLNIQDFPHFVKLSQACP